MSKKSDVLIISAGPATTTSIQVDGQAITDCRRFVLSQQVSEFMSLTLYRHLVDGVEFRGKAEVTEKPAIMPGDIVQVVNDPNERLNGLIVIVSIELGDGYFEGILKIPGDEQTVYNLHYDRLKLIAKGDF